jgi:hypothetical protein
MRLFRLMAAATLALVALGAMAMPAGAQSTGSVDVQLVTSCLCYGDTVTGWLVAEGDSGSATLTLQQGSSVTGPWSSTGKTQSVTITGSKIYPFTFNIGNLDSDFYRIVATSGSDDVASAAIPAESCLPGNEIPEAPAAFLLPASLLGTFVVGGVMWRRRRRSEHQAASLS